MSKPYFIMLVGIPGSGKSRWAQALVSKSTAVVSPDMIRKKISGSVSDQSVNIEAWIQAKIDTIEYLKASKNVILDSTNVNALEWQQFIKDLPECEMVAKLFEVPPEVAYSRIEKDIAYNIERCNVRKACRGMKKTSTIQVIEIIPSGYLIKKQFQFKVGDLESKKKAMKKAKEWMRLKDE